jgi:hypothetical protein
MQRYYIMKIIVEPKLTIKFLDGNIYNAMGPNECEKIRRIVFHAVGYVFGPEHVWREDVNHEVKIRGVNRPAKITQALFHIDEIGDFDKERILNRIVAECDEANQKIESYNSPEEDHSIKAPEINCEIFELELKDEKE